MPFIWDDGKYLLVDELEQYDKSRFVIARKLFVTPTLRNEVSSSPVS